MNRMLKACVWVVAIIGLTPAAGGAQQKRLMDPVGRYAVSTLSDTGAPMQGTLTISATPAGEFKGQFEATGSTVPVPVLSVAVNANQLLAVLQTGSTLALVYVEQAADGTFRGTWHKMGDGIAATLVKAKGAAPPYRYHP